MKTVITAAIVTIAIAVITTITAISNKDQAASYKAKYEEAMDKANTNYIAVQKLNTQVKTMDNTINTLEETINNANKDISILESKIEVANTSINAKDSIIDTNGTLIKEMQHDMKVYFRAVDRLRNSNKNLAATNAEYNNKLNQAKKDLVTLKTKLRYAETFIPKQ